MANQSRKFAAFLAFPEDVQVEMKQRLIQPMQARAVARWLLEEKGLCPGTDLETLTRQVNRYRKLVALPEKTATLQEQFFDTRAAGRYAGSLEVKIDVAKEMTEVAQAQKERLERFMRFESTLPPNAPPLTGVSTLLKEYVATLDRLGVLYMEIGVIPRAPKVFKAKMSPDGEGGVDVTWQEGATRYYEGVKESMRAAIAAGDSGEIVDVAPITV